MSRNLGFLRTIGCRGTIGLGLPAIPQLNANHPRLVIAVDGWRARHEVELVERIGGLGRDSAITDLKACAQIEELIIVQLNRGGSQFLATARLRAQGFI